MTLVQKFTEKYGVNPIKLVEDANLKNFGLAKTLGLQKLLEVFVEDRSLKIEVNNEFLKDLVESFAEAKEKFPENVKASVDTGTKFEVPNQMSGIPKSKGTLENFKDIVGTDDLRPIMMGVYISEDGFIVGTDAHKLVKQKNNGLLSQTDYAGKIIDLTKYIKSKGKLIDFVDGVYPKYDAVIPRDTPYEDRALSTYAFYNYVKSALDVKRLVDAEIFNINFNLMTETSGETKMFSFAYHILFDALNFAMLNGWDVFTLRYSEPNRAVVFDFGGDNIILVLPILDRYGSGASDGSTGTIPLTTEEVEEKYRLGLTSQKASKPKASKPVRTSAPASSEPFKKFEGEFSDTTYIHRSQIDSIKLVSGEVLGKNDIIDGIYRINKKMAHGGYMEKGGKLSNVQLELLNNLSQPNWYMLTNRGSYVVQQGKPRQGGETLGVNAKVGESLVKNGYVTKLGSIGSYSDLTIVYKISQKGKDSISKKMAHGGSIEDNQIYALAEDLKNRLKGKGINVSLRQSKNGVFIYGEKNERGKYKYETYISFSETPENAKDFLSFEESEFERLHKYAHGGSMYAGGGNMFEKPIAMYREVSGKTRNLPQSTEVYESEINRFIDYVHDFYEEEGYSKAEVKSAVNKYLADLGNQDTYGGGDSIDREKVYKYLKSDSLEKSYKSGLITRGEYEQMKSQKEKKYATGGSMPHSHQAGDTVTFKSVMGGTKKGLIVSKLGEDGFRIKTEDGFATVKKSAIV